MSTASRSPSVAKPSLDEKAFREEVDYLRRTDNATNFLYIGRAWLVLAVAIGGFIAFDLWRVEVGLHLLWDLPLWLLVNVVVGASQHQLAGAGHEGTHSILFRNRTLNEVISNWLCMYPILTSTSIYRKQHLEHHQHVNDPERDPDLAQLKSSGHDFDFPMPPGHVIWLFLRQLWLPNLIRYMVHRARYSAVGGGERSSASAGSMPSRLFFPYFFVLFAGLGLLAHLEVRAGGYVLATALMGGGAGSLIFIAHRRTRADSTRAMSEDLQRYAHGTVLLLALSLLHHYTRLETLTYFAVLWLAPLITSFSFFMMLRQTIQHGNCDRGRFSNTRVFLVNPFLRYAVFPFGMDYHLPHHLYATVPHYRLHALHELLQVRPMYQQPGVVVKGCFDSSRKRESEAEAPSVVTALGAEYSLGESNPQIKDEVE